MQVIVSAKPPDVLADDFTASTNEDWTRDYQIQIDGVAVSIRDGWKFFMQMQRTNSGDLGVNLSSDNQRLVVADRATGKFGISLKSADAAQIVPARYVYDIVLVAGDGIYRLVKGTITVEQGITNVPGQEKWSHFPLILRP